LLNPWCLVPVDGGEHVFFGFAVRHEMTGGLAWLVSTEVEELDENTGRARTRSGRRYELGRRFEPKDVADEGDEAAVAFQVLVPEGRRYASLVVNPFDVCWVTCCKAARHLGLPPPARNAADVEAFLDENRDNYFAHRGMWWPR
jgi:hypothetical protein